MIVYKITNLINGKIYVGQDSKNNPTYYGSGKKILLAIKKYGKVNFKKEVLEVCDSLESLNEKEIYWIEKLKSTDKNVGYNISSGGNANHGWMEKLTDDELLEFKNKHKAACGKFNQTQEYKDKMSIISKERWEDKEYREEFLKKWKPLMSKYYTKEKRKEVSEVVKKRYNDPIYKKRWLKSQEKHNLDPVIRKGRSERISGKLNPGWKGYVYMLDDSGNALAFFEDKKTMLELLPLPKETISDCLISGSPYLANICTRDSDETKKLKQKYKGYRFEYRKH